MSFTGRTAVVTGGSRGIGRAICLELARRGANVVFSYAGNTAAAEATRKELEALGVQTRAVQGSVADPAAVKTLIDTAVKELGSLDILVNNAGITRDNLAMMLTSALVGAAGVALGSMVGSLTVGKKKYAAVEADIIALNVRAEALRKRLEALVPADAEAFLPVAAAYKLPKETPEQQAHKAAVLEKALDRACAVPLEVMTACGEGIALAAEYAEKGSVLARSDAGCAALFCKAAMQAAGLNVKVNTRLMADKAHADALEARAEQLLAEFVPQADRVYQTVSNE